MAEYIQKGESLDYKNTTDELIPAGAAVKIGDHIGVAGCPILAGQTGSLHVVGVFKIKKTGTATIEMGQKVYFDGGGITGAANDGAQSNPTAYIEAGYAAAPAEANADFVLVKLLG